MLVFKTALEIVNSFEGVTESEHFGGQAFSANGRIFATFWRDKNEVNVRLAFIDQQHFLEESECFQEIDNAWGRQGMTTILLEFVSRKIFHKAIESAWKYSSQAIRRSSPKAKIRSKKRRNVK